MCYVCVFWKIISLVTFWQRNLWCCYVGHWFQCRRRVCSKFVVLVSVKSYATECASNTFDRLSPPCKEYRWVINALENKWLRYYDYSSQNWRVLKGRRLIAIWYETDHCRWIYYYVNVRFCWEIAMIICNIAFNYFVLTFYFIFFTFRFTTYLL